MEHLNHPSPPSFLLLRAFIIALGRRGLIVPSYSVQYGRHIAPFNQSQQFAARYIIIITRRHVSRNIHSACPIFQFSTYGKHLFQHQFLFPRCKLCFCFTAETFCVSTRHGIMSPRFTLLIKAHFNENPGMRTVAKILRARATEHLSNFCELFHILRALLNWMGHSIPLKLFLVSSSSNSQNSRWKLEQPLFKPRGETLPIFLSFESQTMDILLTFRTVNDAWGYNLNIRRRTN